MKKLDVKKLNNMLAIILCVLFLGVYIYWLVTNNSKYEWYSVVAGAASCTLFLLCALKFVPMLTKAWSKDSFYSGAEHKTPYEKIALMFLISRIIIFILPLVFNAIFSRNTSYYNIWVQGDSPHYIDIAKEWYVTEGDAKFFIVFFPMYPILIKALSFITGEYFISSMLVSNLCSFVGFVFAYKLFICDYDEKTAWRIMRYIIFFPAAFFLSSPMSEGTFFMLTMMSMYYLRKRNYFISCVIAFFAAFTRSLGVVLLVPIFIELVSDCVQSTDKKKFIKYFACLFIVPLGTLAYLYINYSVWSNPMQFTVFQWEHWHQKLGLFFNTIAYQFRYMLSYIDKPNYNALFGISIPNILVHISSLFIMFFAGRKKGMRASYYAYFLAYFIIAIGTTWLLSGPRYLLTCFPLIIGLALIADSKKKDIAISTIMILLQVVYFGLYIAKMQVY